MAMPLLLRALALSILTVPTCLGIRDRMREGQAAAVDAALRLSPWDEARLAARGTGRGRHAQGRRGGGAGATDPGEARAPAQAPTGGRSVRGGLKRRKTPLPAKMPGEGAQRSLYPKAST